MRGINKLELQENDKRDEELSRADDNLVNWKCNNKRKSLSMAEKREI